MRSLSAVINFEARRSLGPGRIRPYEGEKREEEEEEEEGVKQSSE